MAASLQTGKTGLQVQAIYPLFENHGFPFDVSPDGKPFLIYRDVENQPVAPITLIINWAAALKR
jgi:hypothetical protein